LTVDASGVTARRERRGPASSPRTLEERGVMGSSFAIGAFGAFGAFGATERSW
jgi:hypothetical protein